jgi:lysophospholipase L1-like esterase
MDYVNLGFSGNGKAEDEMIGYLAGLEMAAFVSDYDHNAPNAEHLLKTHEKLYREIRKKHPDLPYVIISMPNFLYREDQNARRSIIMETFRNALAEGDRNVYFLDGEKIYPVDKRDECTVDNTHPNDMGYSYMADAFSEIIEDLI